MPSESALSGVEGVPLHHQRRLQALPGSTMPNRGHDISHPKLRGEWAELRFQLRATERGLILARPCGDCAPYDFAVDHHGRFLRVQVKCTLQRREKHSYRCCLDHNGSPYTSDQIDFFAAYVIPADT